MIWAKIRDERTTVLSPDDTTEIDICAQFSFAGEVIPAGQITREDGTKTSTLIGFLVGEANSDLLSNAETVADLSKAIKPIDGITFKDGIDLSPIVQTKLKDENGEWNETDIPVAIVTLDPISGNFSGNITVLAYSTYDKSGKVERLSYQTLELTASQGSGGSYLASLERFNPSPGMGEDYWVELAPMAIPRSGAFCEIIGTKMYVIGGYANEFLKVVEEYDITDNTWKNMNSPMPTPRGFGTSVVYSNKIYVIGGFNFSDGRAVSSVEVYDPSLSPETAWSELEPMPFPLAFFTSQLSGTNIYVFYGAKRFDENDNPISLNSGILKYSILSNEWSLIGAEYSDLPAALTTTLDGIAPIGSTILVGSTYESFGNSGFITINLGEVDEETLEYNVYSNLSLTLVRPTTIEHADGSIITKSSLRGTRLAPGSHINGNTISIFNGYDNENKEYLDSLETFNISTKISTIDISASGLGRSRFVNEVISGNDYVVGGTAEKSGFVSDIESVSTTTGVFLANSNKPLTFRTDACSATNGTYLYVVGGQGNGHENGWLGLSVSISPNSIRADGKSSASVSVSAVDAGGDLPPAGTKVRVKGLIYLPAVDEDGGVQELDQNKVKSRKPINSVSIIPVLFSSNEFELDENGYGSVTLLPRSEDVINAVERLTEFQKSNEDLISQESLKIKAKFTPVVHSVGEKDVLYRVIVEATVSDDYYFGVSRGSTTVSTENNQSFLNPSGVQPGLEATVDFYTDITSIPSISLMTEVPVVGEDANDILDEIKEEIPFGVSPHFDAIVFGARKRIIEESNVTDMMVTVSDNEDSGSSNEAEDVVEEVNSVHGFQKFPIFINTFSVSNPISLSARKARTDVVDLEEISSQTGGNSFSVVIDSMEYRGFIIDRIKVSAPASVGSGSISIPHVIAGPMVSILYEVTGLGLGDNDAVLTFKHSLDGYNYSDYEFGIKPNVEYDFPEPIFATNIVFKVELSSKSFSSPELTSISVRYIKPSVQYLFTDPIEISGQVSEVAIVTNQRLPEGSSVVAGLSHGVSTMFDRDFVSDGQPIVEDRGIIVAKNRSFDSKMNFEYFNEIMTTNNNYLYNAPSGSWNYDSDVRISINNEEIISSAYIAIPEKGVVIFKNKRPVSDVVTIEINNQNQFRIGLKITNPTLTEGKLDSFAFSYGTTQEVDYTNPVSPPRVHNVFISPFPVYPGGPLIANYSYVDANGLDEDLNQSEIVWFRNGVAVPELKNKQQIMNDDILIKRPDATFETKISRGQKWFFSIRPNNGSLYGPLVLSSPIVISNNLPVVSNIRFRSSNIDKTLYTSQDKVTVEYSFYDADGDLSGGDRVAWYVNNELFKTSSSKSIVSGEKNASGVKALVAGNIIRAEITPYDGADFGLTYKSADLTINVAVPVIQKNSVVLTQSKTALSLSVVYTFFDADGGTDNSLLSWYVDGSYIASLADKKTITLTDFALKQRQRWLVVVTPSNGENQGEQVVSNVVVIV